MVVQGTAFVDEKEKGMKPEVAKFTTDRRVTKVEIWNTFRGPRGFRTAQVDVAKSIMGANAPKYWESKGYMVKKENSKGALVYALTSSGKKHLEDGVVRYIKAHPEALAGLRYPPASVNKL